MERLGRIVGVVWGCVWDVPLQILHGIEQGILGAIRRNWWGLCMTWRMKRKLPLRQKDVDQFLKWSAEEENRLRAEIARRKNG